MKFKEVKDRTAIEKLRNTLLMADVDMAEEAEFEDEYHVQQLIGCVVVDEEGNSLGVLADVLNLPGQDLLAINTDRGEVLLPFVAEFVPDVNIEAKRITVRPPDGLFGLNDVEEGLDHEV